MGKASQRRWFWSLGREEIGVRVRKVDKNITNRGYRRPLGIPKKVQKYSKSVVMESKSAVSWGRGRERENFWSS